jgi:hypothetical protein
MADNRTRSRSCCGGALLIAGGSAQGQDSTGNSGGAISLGGRGWSSFEAVPVTSDRGTNQLEFSFRGADVRG